MKNKSVQAVLAGTAQRRKQGRVLRSSDAVTKSKHLSASSTTSKSRRRRSKASQWTRRKTHRTTPIARPPPPTHRTCGICAEEQPIDFFIKWIVPSEKFKRQTKSEVPQDCLAHLARVPRLKNDPVCKPCISKSLVSRMDTRGARTLNSGCLQPNCRSYWNYDFIMKYLPGDALEKYNFGMLNVWKEANTLFTCINEECGTVGLLDRGAAGYPQIECPDCKMRICSVCNVPWHKDITCAELGMRKIAKTLTVTEIDTLQMLQEKDNRRCPNCYLVIEKDGGCDGMFCSGCKTYFNWASAVSPVPGSNRNPLPLGGYPWTMRLPGCEVDGPLPVPAAA